MATHLARPRMIAGFTLIELLFVVALIAVLAAIGVPNFLEAQTRTKVARSKIDMLAIETALQGYYSDHFTYPPIGPAAVAFLERYADEEAKRNAPKNPTPGGIDEDTTDTSLAEFDTLGRDPFDPFGRNPFDPFGRDGRVQLDMMDWYRMGEALNILTTPVAYHRGPIPEDVFRTKWYYDNPKAYDLSYRYVPARQMLVRFPALAGTLDDEHYLLIGNGPSQDDELTPEQMMAYDPTNGTMSEGFLIRRSSDFHRPP